MNQNENENINNESININETVSETGTPSEVPKKSAGREALEWVASILIAVVVALLLRNYVITFVRVDGSSMVPTLTNNDRLIVIRLGYKPQAGDIIILNPSTGRAPYVKRVIGMPGQTVKITETGDVYVDGEKLDEPYTNTKTNIVSASEYTVPENCVFVMGDNRMHSHDSRSEDVSFIPYKNVLGKVVCRVWPLNKIGSVYNK